jgi:hypothetical protein
MVPADSTGISPVPAYSGYPPLYSWSPYGTLTHYGPPSQTVQVSFIQSTRVLLPRPCLDTDGLGCSAFARHYSRNHSCFLFLRLLRCFSSAGSPPLLGILTSQDGLPHSDIHGSAPLAGPRGFSQLGTSFFASRSLGIPRAPLFTYSQHRTPFCKGPVQSFFSRTITGTECFTLLHFLLNMSKNLSRALTAKVCEMGYKTTQAPGPFQKGGVPAAPSGTATLLRLSPSYRFYP